MRNGRIKFDLDLNAVDIYEAGQRVPPGFYLSLEGGREIELAQEEVLPATFDGRVAIYLRRPENWGDQERAAKPKQGN